MGASKNQLFTQKQNELAELAKALGHPARIAILEEMIKTNECLTADLVSKINLAQATISQHIAELKKSEIIIGRSEGVKTCYCINPEKWKIMKELMVRFFDHHPSCQPNCC